LSEEAAFRQVVDEASNSAGYGEVDEPEAKGKKGSQADRNRREAKGGKGGKVGKGAAAAPPGGGLSPAEEATDNSQGRVGSGSGSGEVVDTGRIFDANGVCADYSTCTAWHGAGSRCCWGEAFCGACDEQGPLLSLDGCST